MLIPNEGERMREVFMLLIPKRNECRRLVVLVGWCWPEEKGKEKEKVEG